MAGRQAPGRFTLLPRRRAAESVYFYTFHKCASTLFSTYVLRHVSGLRHRDPAQHIFRGVASEPVVFDHHGYVYGPIRLSVKPGSPVHALLVAPASTVEFVRDRICVFLVRDPRDILVSSYYSYGFTHRLSPVEGIRAMQEEERAAIQAATIDEYVLAQAGKQRADFALLHELHTACRRSVLLRYEDMVNDFPSFAEELCRYLPLSEGALRKAEELSRPAAEVDASKHRRSGKAGQFREELGEETLTALNEQLAGTLELFGYEI